MIKMYQFLAPLFVYLALSSALAAKQPNILIFLVDDLGARDLACYDSEFYESPAIDQLAATGQRYTQAYSAHPRCVPSRYGFFTGRFPARDGCPGNTYNIAAEVTTLGEAMQAGGYRTFYTGKWHLGKKPAEMPSAQGFEISIAAGAAGAPRSYFAPYNQSRNRHHKAAKIPDLEDASDGEYLNERLTDETIQFLTSHQASASDQPFFAILSHYAVHTPIEAKEEDIHYFAEKLGERTKETFLNKDGSTKEHQDNPSYAAMIRSTDQSLGHVMESLAKLGFLENTLIIFTSDHGGLSNRGVDNKRKLATSNLPLRAGKGHLYEGGIRVPFIVRWPGVTQSGSESDAIVTGTDVYATCLEAAGLPLQPDDHVDSVSILPAIRGEAFERSPILWHSPRPRPTSTGDTAASALRAGNYKIMKFYFPEVHYELYDLDQDPYEENDLSKSTPELLNTLTAQIDRSLKAVGAIETQEGK